MSNCILPALFKDFHTFTQWGGILAAPSVFHYIALVIGLVTLLIGVGAVVRPALMSEKFGIKASGATLPYVIATGIRDVFIGLTILSLFYFQLWTAMGFIQISVGVVAVIDFMVVRKHGDPKTSLVHLFGAIFVFGYGFWLVFN